jgi:LPS export ABC transporter protein LptC
MSRSSKYRFPVHAALFALAVIVVLSCENKIDLVPKSELLTLPSLTAKDDTTVFTDSGKVQLRIIFPLLEQYNTGNSAYSEFRHGIRVFFHDGKKEPVGTVSSKYAKYTNSNQVWELRDSVIVTNENRDTLATEVLYWNQPKDLIYTDRFVKITNDYQVIQGFGFESDTHLQHRKIKKVSATIDI